MVEDVTRDNVKDFIILCIPREKISEPQFIEGIKAKERWVCNMLKEYGEVGKIAYIAGQPAGMIQYKPDPKDRVVWITCIFVPNK